MVSNSSVKSENCQSLKIFADKQSIHILVGLLIVPSIVKHRLHVWTKVIIGIGRQRDMFTVGYDLVFSSNETWGSAVAVDEVELAECAAPGPEDSCLGGEYHCEQSRACVDTGLLCDFSDDCGDDSDEDLAYQNCQVIGGERSRDLSAHL